MPVTPDYRDWILELLGRVGGVTGRSMFGGYGLYLDGVFFAVIDDDTLFFKVDESNQPDYEAAGMQPFNPMADEKPMRYYEVPPDVLEDPEKLREWAGRSVAVARKGKKKR
jgi:DNA transformation protein